MNKTNKEHKMDLNNVLNIEPEFEPTFRECLAVAPKEVRKLCKQWDVDSFAALAELSRLAPEHAGHLKDFDPVLALELFLTVSGCAMKAAALKKEVRRKCRALAARMADDSDGGPDLPPACGHGWREAV